MIFLRYLLITFVVFSLLACDINRELPNEETVLLTEKIWTFNTLIGYDDFGTQLGLALYDRMTYQFNANGICTVIALGVAEDITWEFSEDKQIIILKPDTVKPVEWTIITLDEKELTVSFEDIESLNGSVIWTFK